MSDDLKITQIDVNFIEHGILILKNEGNKSPGLLILNMFINDFSYVEIMYQAILTKVFNLQ